MPKRIPSWKVEVAGIDQKGNWASMGRPVQMANLFAKTLDFQILPLETAQEPSWWPQTELLGYTTRVKDVPTNTRYVGDESYQAGSGAYSPLVMGISLGLGGAGGDIEASTVLPSGGLRNNQIAIKRNVIGAPDDMYWVGSSQSIPATLGSNGGPSLPALPCFAVVFYDFKSSDDDPAPDPTHTCGGCLRPVPRHSRHINIQWGGCWQLTILFAQKGVQPFAQVAKAYLTYYREGKVWSINKEGWTVPSQSLTEATWIGGDLAVCIAEINGRIVIFWNGDYGNAAATPVIVPREQIPDYDEAQPGVTNLPPAPMSNTGRFDTPSAPLYIHGDAMSCQFSVHGIDFEPGAWVREYYGVYPRGADIEASSCMPIGYVPSNDPDSGLSITVADAAAEPGERPSKIITCVITKDATMPCRASPLLAGYSINQLGDWTETDQTWVDISNSVTRISESSTEPLTLGTAEFVVDLDVALLDQFYQGWRNNVRLSVPIRIWMGWDGEVVPRLDGFVYDVKPKVTAYNEANIQLVCRDPIMKTQDPVGIIDFQYFPLDCYSIHLERAAYGWEAVQGILRMALGDTLANRFYYAWPEDHHDLYTALPFTRGATLSGGEVFLWAPNWGGPLYDWLSEVATYDGSMLYIRPYTPDGGITWYNVPFYVHWNEFRKDEYKGVIWNTHRCYDRLYPVAGVGIGGSTPVEGITEAQYDSHIKQAEAQWNLREAVNIVEVWVQDSEMPYPMSVYYAEDPNIGDSTAPNYVTWEQKLIYQINKRLVALIAQAIGTGLANRFFNRRPVRATYKTLGQPYWWWGDKIIPSGDQIGIEDDELRIWRLNSVLDTATLTYETTVTLVEEPGGMGGAA